MLGIDGKEKPVYRNGDEVSIDLAFIGYDAAKMSGKRIVPGVVRGISSQNLVDFWIVEFREGSPFPETYPYSCAVLPHNMIFRKD